MAEVMLLSEDSTHYCWSVFGPPPVKEYIRTFQMCLRGGADLGKRAMEVLSLIAGDEYPNQPQKRDEYQSRMQKQSLALHLCNAAIGRSFFAKYEHAEQRVPKQRTEADRHKYDMLVGKCSNAAQTSPPATRNGQGGRFPKRT